MMILDSTEAEASLQAKSGLVSLIRACEDEMANGLDT
jgi:hypothetical protein